MSLEVINKKNLFSFYSFIGTKVFGYELNHDFVYSSIKSSVNCWPNCIWNINEKEILKTTNTSILFSNCIEKGQLLITSDDMKIYNLFKQNDYLFIDQWKGMCLEISEKTKPQPIENYYIKVIDEDFGEWIDFVSRYLFKGGHLSENIFIELSDNKHILIGLYLNKQIIGSTLLYFDEDYNGSIYMVCIDSKFRGLGLGKLIVNYAIDLVKTRNIKKIFLQSTKIGYQLYKSLGFIDTNTYNLYIKK